MTQRLYGTSILHLRGHAGQPTTLKAALRAPHTFLKAPGRRRQCPELPSPRRRTGAPLAARSNARGMLAVPKAHESSAKARSASGRAAVRVEKAALAAAVVHSRPAASLAWTMHDIQNSIVHLVRMWIQRLPHGRAAGVVSVRCRDTDRCTCTHQGRETVIPPCSFACSRVPSNTSRTSCAVEDLCARGRVLRIGASKWILVRVLRLSERWYIVDTRRKGLRYTSQSAESLSPI